MSTLRVEFPATDSQWSFFDAREKYVLGSGGYGSGKSEILTYSCLGQCIANPGMFGMVVADTYGRLARDFLPKFKARLDKYKIKHRKIKPIIDGVRVKGWEIGPGWLNHTLLFASAQQPQSLKGPNLSHIHVEEATTIRDTLPGLEEPVFNVMMSRLRAVRADGMIGSNILRASGTPESLKNWTMRAGLFWRPPVDRAAHDQWRREFRVVRMSTRETEAMGFVPKGLVASMMAVMTPSQIEEKIDGMPKAGAAGAAYPEFIYTRNVRPCAYDALLGEIIVGLDFNVNPMTATLMQWNRGVLQIFGEIKLPHSTTQKCADEIIRRAVAMHVPLKMIRVYPDASGRARRTTGESDFDVLRAAGLKRIIYPKQGNPYVSERLNSVNAALYHERLVVDPSCVETIADFEQTAVDDYGELIKTDPERTHLTDGVGYVVTNLMPIRGGRAGLAKAA